VRITPSDIEKQEFTVKMRGYDKEEVRNFLLFIAQELSNLLLEMDELKKRYLQAEERIKEMESREKILKETLIAAQRFSEELKANAKKEAEITIKEAELKADQILSKAMERLRDVNTAISKMKAEKQHIVNEIRAFVISLQELIAREESDENSGKGASRSKARKGAKG